jgi:tRNA threonylcarbamoyl adenosine modification protein YeaZ
MNILSIEQSTSLCSMALMKDCRLAAGREWEDAWSRNQHFFSLLPGLFQEASVTPAEVDIFAVGLGPGSFSGLRCALAAMNGLSLPDKKRVFGISSAEILAWQVMRETGHNSVMVLGDARRSYIWYSCYEMRSEMPFVKCAVALATPDQLPAIMQSCECISTPDWDRIGETLKQIVPHGIRLTLGELVFRKIGMTLPSEPLAPIYLHPPVAARK